MVWIAHPLLGGHDPVGALYDIFQLGTGGAEDVGLNLQRVRSARRHRRVENADAHDACAPGRAGRAEAKDAGFRLVTLSNSPPDPQNSPPKQRGIKGWSEKSFSFDRVGQFKPAPQVYNMVAQERDVPPAAICM